MKSRGIAVILAFLLGGLGVHKFYLERPGIGFLYLVFSWTFIPAVLAVLEGFWLLFMGRERFDRKYNGFAKA